MRSQSGDTMSCSDTQRWFHQTQDLYNEILLFYYQLYLETFLDEQPGTQEALRILEKLTIVGRDKQPVPNPIPWKKVPLYFRRAAINTATAAAKSYLAREEQEQPTEAFTESVTFYKGMYRDFQQNTISLKLWDGEGWQWCRLRLRGNTVPEEGQMMSPALVLKKDRAELHIPWKIPVADGRGAVNVLQQKAKYVPWFLPVRTHAQYAVFSILPENERVPSI